MLSPGYHRPIPRFSNSFTRFLRKRLAKRKNFNSERRRALIANRIASVALVFCLLSTSTPAATQTIAAFASDVKFSFTLWLRSSELGTKVMAAIQNGSVRSPKPQEKQQERDQRVKHIQIYPGAGRLWVGQEAKFAAVAFERENVSVGGVAFTWSILNDEKDHAATISQTGMFVSQAAGIFEIAVEGAGKAARTTITVLDAPANHGPARETKVSSKSKARPVAVRQSAGRRSGRSAHHRSLPSSDRRHFDATMPSASTTANLVAAPPLEGGEDPYGWNDQNYWSADEPANRIGNSPNGPDDGGSSSGNFQMTAPIISLPGRNMDINLSLIYNSRVWNKAGSDVNFDINQDWPAAGWSLGFGKIVSAGSQGDMIVDPDGTRHPFAGTATSYGTPLPTAFNLHTTDGTMISYSVSHVYSGGVRSFWGAIAYYPNGMVVRYMAYNGDSVLYPTYIEDHNRNGIIITYLYNNYTNPRIETVIDTLGRTILFHYDANNFNLLTAITASGLPDANGNIVARTLVRLHYKQLNLLEYGSYGFAPGINPLVRNPTINVIDAIYYPGSNTGYWFGDTDSYSSYGMIRKVTQQRGMGFSTSTGAPLNEQGVVSPGTMTRQLVYNYPTTPDTTLQDAPSYTTLSDDWLINDTDGPAVTHYNIDNAATPRTTTIIRPDGSYSVQCSYNYSGLPSSDPDKFKDGLTYETKLYDGNNRLLGKKTVAWEQGAFDSPRPQRVEMTDEVGQVTATEYSYGTYNQVTEVREYDYGGLNLLRITRMEYQFYPYHYLINLPTLIEVYNGDATTRLSRTEYQYESYYPLWYAWGIPGTVCGYASDCPNLGNPTKVVTYANAADSIGPVTQELAYDQLGNVVSVATRCSDGTLCDQTTYTFTADTQYAYPSSETRGSSDPNSPTKLVASSTYDFNTGLQLSTTDPNLRTSQADYSTETWRPTRTISPTGAHTEFTFDDNGLSFAETTYTTDETISAQNVKRLNGRGQLYREEALAGSNIWDVVQTTYDQVGRVWKASRPFRSSTNSVDVKWSEYSYDALGRVKQVLLPDGSGAETSFNDPVRPSGASSAPGQTMKLKDPWGRERWIRKDSQGQIAEVIEPNPDGNGSVASGGLITTYGYDLLGNLIQVVQGDQTRVFRYDSLGRLTQQKLAEMSATLDSIGNYVGVGAGTWSDVFSYDERSNVTAHIDARGVKTSFSFSDGSNHPDPLNRLQSVSYDTQSAQNVLSSPPVAYSYMTSGDLTRVSSITTSGIGTEAYAYDSEGRVRDKTLTLTSRPPMMTTYLYDSLNRVTDIYYPQQYGVGTESRRVVHQDYDIESRLSRLRVDGADYASNIVYNAASQTTSINVGNGTGEVLENYNYEPQTGMLATQTIARSSAPQDYLLNLSYDYTDVNGKRTGQLTKILNNRNHNRDRGYIYDAVGRLKQATGGSTGSLWNQTYSYDRYGNRTSVSATGYSAWERGIPMRNSAGKDQQVIARGSGTTEPVAAATKPPVVAPPAEPKVEMPTDLLARNNIVEMPRDSRSMVKEGAASSTTAPLSDTSTPLYRPYFPYASLNSLVFPATPQSGSAKIAFASNRNGTAQLYSMNTDGSGLLQLTNDAANDEAPNWSPNNSRIVFQSDRDNLFSGSADIYVMNWDGSGQTRLTSDVSDDSAPVWSPDGTKIAFQSARNGVNYQVYVMNTDGSGQVNVSNNSSNEKQPSWSPDGAKIAFASDRDHPGTPSVYVMNANGSNQTRLTFSDTAFRDEQPVWSPNGMKLAFTSTRDSVIDTWQETDDEGGVLTRTAVRSNKEVYLMNADGSAVSRLTNTLENDDSPAWSGDGTKIVFRSDRERDGCDPTQQVWVMNSDGNSQLNLSANPYGDHCPSWQHLASNVPPTVSLTSPANGSSFIAPANITVTANASDSDGTVSRVDFYQGTTLIGTDTTAPYSLDWNNVAAGTYPLSAKAIDNGGANTTSGAVTISVNSNAAPAVSITSPTPGTYFNGPANITITANASDSDGTISKVDFYQGTTLIGTDTTAPYSLAWSNVAASSYSLTAKATDNLGATSTSAAVPVTVNAVPTASVTSPVNGATFTAPANFTISANASDSDGTISSVDFYQGTTLIGTDTTAPYSLNWNNVAAGNYSLTARATDNGGGASTSAAVNVTVNANGAPLVSITSPANGASVTAPANITIEANASDSDGAISKVDFYQGTTLIGTDTTAPYIFVWNNVATGNYSLTAKATDNGGTVATSNAVVVTVNPPNQSPISNIGGPYTGTTATAIQFNGSGSTDPDGTITSYQWDFGDNTTGTGATPTHAYSIAGSYTVTLTVTDNSAAQASASATATINLPVIPTDGLGSLTYDVSNNHITTSGFAYDSAGNLTRGLGSGGAWQQYQYDAAGRLVKIKSDDGQTLATYVYGHSNRRLATQYGGESSNIRTNYVWGAEDVLVEYSESDLQPSTPIWSKSYVYLNTTLLATVEPGTSGDMIEFQHPDQIGTRVITNPANGTSFEQAILPFGTALDAESTGTTNRRFTSYDRGPTGVDYALNRSYNSSQGRFTQVDPIGMQSTSLMNPQSLNLYAYCQNDPINSTDSAGTWGFSISFGWGSGSGNTDLSRRNLGGILSFALGLLGSIFQGRHIIGTPFLPNPIPGNSSPPPPPPKVTTVALAGSYSARYEEHYPGSNSAFAARALESTRNKKNFGLFRTGKELIEQAEGLSNRVGTIGRLNIFSHAFPPGIIGNDSNSEGLYIGDPGNIVAYHTLYSYGNTYDYYHYNALLSDETRGRGARTVEELATLINDGRINIANGGEIVFYGCYTDAIASHLAYHLKDRRPDIRVTGSNGSVSMERSGYAFTWGTGQWNTYKGDKYQGHTRSKRRSYR